LMNLSSTFRMLLSDLIAGGQMATSCAGMARTDFQAFDGRGSVGGTRKVLPLLSQGFALEGFQNLMVGNTMTASCNKDERRLGPLVSHCCRSDRQWRHIEVHIEAKECYPAQNQGVRDHSS
jgi:hypothetical protein